jgi:hypothetical protein
VLDKIEKAKKTNIKFLESTDVLILTLGTAFVHELKDSNTIVSNCHKQASQLFQKRLLSVEEITSQFDSIYHNINPKTQIVLNISPVRHTKDGMAENQLSKSTLRVACSIIESKYKNVSYLPTYEKMIDDLRDYRFYKEDLIHPNNQSVEIIFKEFSNSFFTKEAIALMQEVKKIQIGLNHRSLFDKSMSHQQFLSKLKAQIIELNKEIDLSSELQKIEELIG